MKITKNSHRCNFNELIQEHGNLATLLHRIRETRNWNTGLLINLLSKVALIKIVTAGFSDDWNIQFKSQSPNLSRFLLTLFNRYNSKPNTINESIERVQDAFDKFVFNYIVIIELIF